MLADDIAAALPGLRTEAERLMLDACTITRAATGKGPFNETTGKYDTPAPTTPYTGKCRVQITSDNPTDTNAGGPTCCNSPSRRLVMSR
jgi:hypothetical protein